MYIFSFTVLTNNTCEPKISFKRNEILPKEIGECLFVQRYICS